MTGRLRPAALTRSKPGYRPARPHAAVVPWAPAPRSSGRKRPAVLLACLLACTVALPAGARVIHSERSLYQTILVDKAGPRVCLRFGVRRNQHNQSCIDQRRPREMVFPYTRMMMASLLLNPSPGRILVVGLGGGTLPAALAQIYGQATVDAVEIDAAVVTVAERYFGFAANDRLRVHVQDARAFVKRAASNGAAYDLIMLDAFNSDYIPEHLMTREFLLEARSLLTQNGVLAANTFASSRLYDHESVTYADVFGRFFNLRLPETLNRVILASRQPLPGLLLLQQRAAELEERLRPFGVDLGSYPKHLLSKADWDTGARVLTDQYAPANLLREQ